MSESKFWMLKVIDATNSSWCIWGFEEVFRRAIDEWKTWKESSGPTARLLEVHGFCDTARREEVLLCILMEHVAGFYLVAM